MKIDKLCINFLLALKMLFLLIGLASSQLAFASDEESDDDKEQLEQPPQAVKYGFGVELVFVPQKYVDVLRHINRQTPESSKILNQAISLWVKAAPDYRTILSDSVISG